MMKKHDETIQYLFDDYAEELTPRQDLAEKAKMEMIANNQAKSSASARKNSFKLHLAWIAPVAVVFIAVIAIIFTLPIFRSGQGNLFEGDTVPSEQPSPTVAYYTYADVKGRSVNIDDYDDMLQVSKLNEKGYQIVGQRCYAFFTDKGELRYVKAYLGVRSSDGTFTELELIGEVDGYVRKDLREIYDRYSDIDGLGVKSSYDDRGEYVTQGYFAARNFHFYAVARNGQYTQAATDILQTLSQQGD